MKKVIEGLLPIDPVGALNKIKDNYLRYFETAYRFEERYPGDDLDKRKNEEMRRNNNLFHEYPYCEIIPEYISDGKHLSCLIDELNSPLKNKFPDGFAEFIKLGLMDYPPYRHQFESLISAFVEGKNTVITSGTGSGKTESFMLPLLASLFKEMTSWPAQNYDKSWYLATNTDGDKYDRAYQRANETDDRPVGIRALIMYPMNALVEDQIARLRKAIDGDHIRQYLDTNFGGNRIFFGQYNSSTIGHKSLDGISVASDKEIENCFEKLSTYSENYEKLLAREDDLNRQLNHLNSEKLSGNPSPDRLNELEIQISKVRKELLKIKDAWYIAPRLNQHSFSSEMVTRWDMQDKAPDVLITNFSMLSAMMMRSSESKMFKDSRRWFQIETDMDVDLSPEEKEAEKEKRVFHLVLDELHLYRGTAGTEVAYLIRSFLNEIGVPPVIKDVNGYYIPNKQLRIIASSASLDDPQDFLKQFFGVYDELNPKRDLFNIIRGSDYIPQDSGVRLDYKLFGIFARKSSNDGGLEYIDDLSSRANIKKQFIQSLNQPDVNTLKDFAEKYREQIFYDFKKACLITSTESPDNCRFVPRSLRDIADKIFSGDIDALRGFFIFRADPEIKDLKLPRFRFHQFFKYVEGLWGELTEATRNNHQQVIGDVMYIPQEVVKKGDVQHKVLELLRCECCGELFIGGNRRTIDHDNYYLTLNYPELERIPNRNPTPMVQNKRYPAYAIFWPHEEHIDMDPFTPIGSDGSNSISKTGFRGNWQKAFLNPADGKMECSFEGDMRDHSKWIKGYTYMITPCNNNGDENNIMALPCVCPHCDKDYHYRKYTKSPIRSFRSGISRSNQMICKELFYQLPSDNKKLIGFSDSRQDAAEQSSDIAEEHYRDMVRLSFMECVSKPVVNNLDTLKQLIITLISSGAPDESVQSMISISKDVSDVQKRLLSQYARNRDIDAINRIKNDGRIIPLSNIISSGAQLLGGDLVKKLLQLGINPAGPSYADQTIDGHHWSWAYDFHNLQANSNLDAEKAAKTRDRLSAAVFHNSFGEFFKLSAEDVGLGYITASQFNENNRDYIQLKHYLNLLSIDIKEFLDAYIRVLGDHFRYKDPDSIVKINNHSQITNENNDWDSYSRYASSCKKHIGCLAERLLQAGVSISPVELGDLVHNTLEASGIRMAELTLPQLGFHTVSPKDRYFECPKCHRVHLHWGMGMCTNVACREPLDSNNGGFVQEIYDRNFVAYDLMKEKRKGCRIHTEELTGQTDDQSSRLLDFKGIILDDPDQAISREIDMINVTTTMEVGVDIGGLLAVFQGNMPPTRYNYQQRVGRGGRRGQPFSTAITFCRGKSHDTYYYKDAVEEMLGGIPTQPKLSIRPSIINSQVLFNDEIVKRVILKQVLHMAMTEYVIDESDIDPTDVIGEFGLVEDWNTRVKPHLISWIENHHNAIEDTVHYYLDQYNTNGILKHVIDSCISWFVGSNSGVAGSACIRSIDSAVASASCRGLGQCLAEAGLLPLYGMPSNSRVLYHGSTEDGYREIDRPVEQSITEFAPGAIKTKDHGYYTSAGLTTNFKMRPYGINKEDDDSRTVNIDDNRWDVFEFCHCLKKDTHSDKISFISPQVQDINSVENSGDIPLIIPKAYRTKRIINNDGRKSNNDDTGNYTQSTIWADANHTSGVMKQEVLPNASVKYWSCGGENKPTVWYVNDNNGKLFTGKRAFFTKELTTRNGTIELITGDSPKHVAGNVDGVLDQINVFPSFLCVSDSELRGHDNIRCYIEEENGLPVQHSVALGAKKVTEMICISIQHVNSALNLCIGGLEPGYEPAIIAAYYSAATLIQRTFADELDIQPEEIDISEIKIENGNACIYMSDALANGSGYVGMLMEKVDGSKTRLQVILEKIVKFDGSYLASILNHKDNCKTACPQCLRTYQNAGYHHVLDWRLGVDLIKLMLDSAYDMGYSDLSNTPYGDLQEQMRIAGFSVAENNPLIELKSLQNGLYCLCTKRMIPPFQETQEVIVHPLWKHDPNEDQNFFELLRTGYKLKQNARSCPIENTSSPVNNITFHI